MPVRIDFFRYDDQLRKYVWMFIYLTTNSVWTSFDMMANWGDSLPRVSVSRETVHCTIGNLLFS